MALRDYSLVDVLSTVLVIVGLVGLSFTAPELLIRAMFLLTWFLVFLILTSF